MGKSVLLLSFALHTKPLSLVNNQIPLIVQIIADYNYKVIDYDYIASGNGDYNYLKSCNQLQSITITDYDYPNPGLDMVSSFVF